MGYLHNTIDNGYQAAAATPLVHPERAIRLHTLAANLYQRFAQTGADDDIQQAILIAEEAVTSLPNDHEERAPWMRNLSDLLTWKYLHTGAVDDLQLAII